MSLLEIVLDIFVTYGYFFLFFATAFENVPVVGAFLPGEVIVVAAGFFASSGDFNLTLVILVAGVGAFVGTNLSYGLGYWGGRTLIEKFARRVGMDGDRLRDADRYFHTHGPITVFVGRYMSGIKAFVPALAGAHRMNYWRFLFFSTLGVISWTIVAATLGFYFGRNWETLIDIIKTIGWAIPVVIVVVIALFWYRRKRRAEQSVNSSKER